MVKYKIFYTYFSICGIIPGIMAYSTDLRKRVLDFIDNGGSKVKAAKLFNISRDVIYKWLNAPDPLAPKKSGPKGPRCIDYKALTQQVKDFPIKLYRSAQIISAFPTIVFGMDCENSVSREKKDTRL